MAVRVSAAAGLFVAWAVAGITLMPSCLEAATFHGTVVDADTGEPLEGAVIVAIWMRHAQVPVMHSVAKPYKAVERLADAQGRFAADDSAGLFTFGFHSRQVMVVKPGYRRLTTGTHDRWAPLFSESIVRLTKIRTQGEFRQHLTEGLDVLFICNDAEPGVLCLPRLWVPNLARINDIQTRISEAAAPGVDGADAKSWTPLHYAALAGHAEKLETLLAAGAPVNAQSERGWTPLTLAVMRRHTATARRLLAAGADVNLKSGAGDPPIIIASQFELVQIALAGSRLQIASTSPGEPTQATVAPAASAAQTIRNREPALVEVLLDAGADPNSRDRDGLTPLMWAAAQGRLELVQLLLSRGADPNAKASYGIMAWHLAVGEDVIRAFRAARPKP
jgi:hypothetical protein